MIGFMMFIHAVVSILLLIVILMQSGRGGGLTEGFASTESMLGAQTNEFMIKATTVLGTLFLITCMGLAYMSSQKGKSLMTASAPVAEKAATAGEGALGETAPELPPITVGGETPDRPAVKPIPVETGAEETVNRAASPIPVEEPAANEPPAVPVPESE